MEIAGRPTAELFVVIENNVEAQLSVKLSAVGPDGRSNLITHGSAGAFPRRATGGRARYLTMGLLWSPCNWRPLIM